MITLRELLEKIERIQSLRQKRLQLNSLMTSSDVYVPEGDLVKLDQEIASLEGLELETYEYDPEG